MSTPSPMGDSDLRALREDDAARTRAGNGLFLVAMVLVGAALLLGPVVVITSSPALLNGAIALGLIGVAVAIAGAIRSYIA